MSDALEDAVKLHNEGRLDAAVEAYERVLAEDPFNRDALSLLGALRSDQGDHAGAMELIGRLVDLEPNVPRHHVALAELHRTAGDLARALGCCRVALALWPDDLDALCGVGLALQAQGRHADAAETFLRLLEVRPGSALAHNNLGVSLHALGLDDEALEHFRRAVELDPAFPPSLISLGEMLADRGRYDEALVHCREAVRLEPDSAPIRFNLGLVLESLGEHLEARGAFLEALRLDPDLIEPLFHVGKSLAAAGRLADALPWIQRASTLDPEDAEYLAALAELHSEQDKPDEATACWERVVALSPPDRVAPRLSLALALREINRHAEADEQVRAALAIKPELPEAHLNLGQGYVQAGDFPSAEACFRAALRLGPEHVGAHVQLATLLGGRLPDADFEALKSRLRDPGLKPGQRTRLLFALAHVLDACGEYGPAAESSREANALEFGAFPYPLQYHPACRRALIDTILEAFPPAFFDRVSAGGLETRRPVFVFGLPRSGTTLTEQILASHPRAFGAGELTLASETCQLLPSLLGRGDPPVECIGDADANVVRRLAEAHLEKLSRYDGGRADRVVDKMPENYLHLGLLAAMFPGATFIHCRRDLRDTALSCWMTDFKKIRWANHPEHIASSFENYLRCMDAWLSVLPVEVHEVWYEDTVADLECVARRLVEACGLDWDPACLDFHRKRRPILTASMTQVREPVYSRSVGRWRRYEEYLPELFDILPSQDSEARCGDGFAAPSSLLVGV